VKEIKFGPNTEEHDFNFKLTNATKFLKQHNKVKFTVRFRGRQMAHKELGYKVLEKVKAEISHIADVDSEPVSDRNLLSMVVSPKKEIDRILAKDAKAVEPVATDIAPVAAETSATTETVIPAPEKESELRD